LTAVLKKHDIGLVRITWVFLGAIFLTVIERFTATGGALKVKHIILHIYSKELNHQVYCW